MLTDAQAELQWLVALRREHTDALAWFDEYADTAWARYGWQRPTTVEERDR